MMEYIDKYVWYQEGPGVRKQQYTSEGIKLLNVANLVDGKIDLSTSHRYISKKEAQTKYKHFLVDEGDLIIASSGIQVDYFDKKMGFAQKEHLPLCMNTSTIRFKVLNPKVTNIKYFMWFLKSSLFKMQLSRLITGSAQLNFGPSHLKKIKIDMPIKSEQDNIVNKLDKVQEIIDLRKKQIEELDELIKSQFVDMFGDPFENKNNYEFLSFDNFMERCVDIGSNGANKVVVEHLNMKDTEDYALLVRTLNFTSNDFKNNVKYISKEAYEFFKKSQVYGGEIIFNKIGSAGINFLMPRLNRPVSLGLNQIMITPKDINTRYLYDFLNTEYGKYQINSRVNGAVTKSIQKTELKKILIMQPPISKQNEYVYLVEQIDKQKLMIEKSLKETEKLQESLMNRYFR